MIMTINIYACKKEASEQTTHKRIWVQRMPQNVANYTQKLKWWEKAMPRNHHSTQS